MKIVQDPNYKIEEFKVINFTLILPKEEKQQARNPSKLKTY